MHRRRIVPQETRVERRREDVQVLDPAGGHRILKTHVENMSARSTENEQLASKASLCRASGTPSTWFPLEELVQKLDIKCYFHFLFCFFFIILDPSTCNLSENFGRIDLFPLLF